MRFLTADYLYPLHINPLKNGVLQISNKGEVISIFEDRKSVPKEKLEVYCNGKVFLFFGKNSAPNSFNGSIILEKSVERICLIR